MLTCWVGEEASSRVWAAVAGYAVVEDDDSLNRGGGLVYPSVQLIAPAWPGELFSGAGRVGGLRAGSAHFALVTAPSVLDMVRGCTLCMTRDSAVSISTRWL